MPGELDTDKISEWRSIVTLAVFVLTNIVVLFPFKVPYFVPRSIVNGILDALSTLRVLPSRRQPFRHDKSPDDSFFVRLEFPLNLVTAPLVADLFLLAISAIGRSEVKGGTIGADNISPLDIMIFFITLAYIAISIDASGLIRWLAFKVLQLGGKVGHKLFFYLYAFFFCLGSFIGNDPIILSGTAFLAYMTRVSKNILHPKAWIFSQFAMANIASAILVSSNPTNLVLAGAFEIRFITYTANMVVPVVITAIVLFPFLLYILFADEGLIPSSIEMYTLPNEPRGKPVNPNIPHARGHIDDQSDDPTDSEETKLLSLEEIMHPFLDKGGAAFGALIMAATLITLLALNAASAGTGEHSVYWVTLPAAFVMFCWDVGFGWFNREETRKIAREGRRKFEEGRAKKRALAEAQQQLNSAAEKENDSGVVFTDPDMLNEEGQLQTFEKKKATSCGHDVSLGVPMLLVSGNGSSPVLAPNPDPQSPIPGFETSKPGQSSTGERGALDDKQGLSPVGSDGQPQIQECSVTCPENGTKRHEKSTLVSLTAKWYQSLQETFPTVTAVLAHLPFALVPFAFAMFVLVQALVTKGWVTVFAFGWDHWVDKTGTIGAIGGMGFLSVVLCNFAGTNIGTTILLSRVIQQWRLIHEQPHVSHITNRTFWATVYSMALGVNYGAFSAAFSASLAGLLWRDILLRKHITVHSLDFARVNFPIIAVSMTVGCIVLIAQVYITRDETPYKLG